MKDGEDMGRVLLFSSILLAHAALLAGSFLFWHGKFQSPHNPASNKASGEYTRQASLVPGELQNEKVLVLLFAGDIMLDRGVEWHMRQRSDWTWPFLAAAPFLKKADLAFANLESVISNKGEKQGSIYSFRADPRALEGLVFAGFDILSVANNHSLDYGSAALLDSMERLREVDIIPAGGGKNKTEAHAPALARAKETTIGLLAYTSVGSPLWQARETSPGIAFADITKLAQLKEDIQSAKEKADIVVVSFHFGEEYKKEPSQQQRLLGTSAVDYGADLVVGHHPHVAQPLEQYKEGWVAWSLGNFVFDQGFSEETMEGMMLQVFVKQKNIARVAPLNVRLTPSFQPVIAAKPAK